MELSIQNISRRFAIVLLLGIACVLIVTVCLELPANGQGPPTLLGPVPPAEVAPPASTIAPLLTGPVVELPPGAFPFPFPIPDFGTAPTEVSNDNIPWLPDVIDPNVWFPPAVWQRSFQLGINGSEGNASAFSMRTGMELSRDTERTNWGINLSYRKAEAGRVETQHNALLYSNWDYKLNNPSWSWINKLGIEYDEFKDFNVRLNVNTGIGYQLIDTPDVQFRPRFGAGTSHEFGSEDDKWKPEAVFGFDFTHHITPTQKFMAVFDYFPNWGDFADFRIVTDAGWEWLLSEANNLSLKIGVIDRYDSTPGSADPNDIDYSILLIWAR